MEDINSKTIHHAKENQNPIDIRAAKSLQFTNSLEQIQSKPLNPDNIDTYASDALAELIRLTGSITNEFAKEKSGEKTWGKELEDSAFVYFGLENLGEILEHVASKENEIKKIGQVIEQAENISSTIVPPQRQMHPIQEGDGSFGKKEIISRTKTLLFILANDFKINIDDPEQLSLKTGTLSDDMMRKLSYFMIDVPSLKRTILCCDEEGNVTYIFDNDILSSHGISADKLTMLSKPKINDLLNEDPKLGKRIIYSKNFVPRMIGLIENLEESETSMPQEESGFYLYPKPPEGILSTRGIASKLGVGEQDTVKKVIDELGDTLGEVNKYKFPKITEGYTPQQQEKIKQALTDKGIFTAQAPEDILSSKKMASKFKVGYNTINKVIEKLGDNLGETYAYRFGAIITTGYTPKQQEMIRQVLNDKGFFTEQAPEGVLSTRGIADKFGDVNKRTVNKAIEELGDDLGEVGIYRFGTKITTGYTPKQQEIIRQALENKGIFSEQAPEGVLSTRGIADKFGVDKMTIRGIIAKSRDTLGEVNKYKFGSNITAGYNSEQQEMIRQLLVKKGLTKPQQINQSHT